MVSILIYEGKVEIQGFNTFASKRCIHNIICALASFCPSFALRKVKIVDIYTSFNIPCCDILLNFKTILINFIKKPELFVGYVIRNNSP